MGRQGAEHLRAPPTLPGRLHSRPSCALAAQVSPITMYNSEFALELRRQIAVNAHYICYALRQGQLRLLHRRSAERALLKSKGAAITDVQCGPLSMSEHLKLYGLPFSEVFLFEWMPGQ